MTNKICIKGMVTTIVYDKDGNVKRREPGFFRRLFGLPGKEMISRHHNIITKQGDSLIVDALEVHPYFPKIDMTTGYVQIGTGWNGINTKYNRSCNEPTGIMKNLTYYPDCLYSLSPDGKNGMIYEVTFQAGELNVNGINEACLFSKNENMTISLAYSEITPPANVAISDSLEIIWEVLIEGK
jgi:hypothetical protein